MCPTRRWVVASSLFLVWVVAFGTPLVAADFPPITDRERALTAVPGQEGAPAVVLFDRGTLRFADPSLEEASRFEVVRREKILTTEGLDRAQITVDHDRVIRLLEIEARAVLSDGREIVAQDDAIFEERLSKADRRRRTKVVIPGVEVGAILDVRYVYSMPNLVALPAWTFGHVGIPTLLSEVTYLKPNKLGLRFWGLETTSRKIRRDDATTIYGASTRAWMENLPPIPDEPLSFPTVDVASKFQAIPTAMIRFGSQYELYEDWASVVDWIGGSYRDFRKNARDAKAKGKEIARQHKDERARAEAAFRFVRDRVENRDQTLLVSTDDANQVLEAGAGSSIEAALLLEAVLEGAKLDPQLVWLADRFDGRFDPSVASPGAFDGAAIALELDGRGVLLDPSSPALAFGRVSPRFEGMPFLRVERKAPVATVEASGPTENGSHAVLEWTVGEDGVLHGTGTVRHEGAAAWRIYHEADAAVGDVETIERVGRRQLEGALTDFRIESLETTLEEGAVVFAFEVDQREEDVLGDQATLWPSRPLPTAQPYTLPAAERLTPVQTLSAFADRVDTTIRWPEGWTLDVLPRGADVAGDVGSYRFVCTQDAPARTARCERSLVQARAEYFSNAEYKLLRQLYEEASTLDGQPLVLVSPP